MDIEKLLLDVLNGAGEFNFNTVIYTFGVSLVAIWLFTTVWVWTDSGERTSNIYFRIASVVLVLPLNIPGLIVYLIMRPKETIEGIYWSDLERRYLMYETAELGDCTECGYQLSPGFNVCPNCSHHIKQECTSCKVMIDREWQFCPFCSTEQPELSLGHLSMLKDRQTEKNVDKKTEKLSHESISGKQARKTPDEKAIDSPKKVIAPRVLPEDEDIVTDAVTKEDMDKKVQENREHMVDTVENKGTRYKVATGVSVKLGKAVMKGVLAFGEKINNVFVGIRTSLSAAQAGIAESQKVEADVEELSEVSDVDSSVSNDVETKDSKEEDAPEKQNPVKTKKTSKKKKRKKSRKKSKKKK